MTFHAFRRLRLPATAAVLVSASLLVAACGSDGSSSTGSGSGNAVDLAFVEAMIPHHRSAVSMANIAQRRGVHPEIKSLADDIVRSQSAEILQMEKRASLLKADGVKAGDLGPDGSMTGMPTDDAALQTVTPFDKAFVDMMIPHHQAAIRMARIELAKGKGPETKKLARAIIAAQSREIGQMNSWRMTWYGAASPAGGVPAAGDQPNGGSTHGM